ncbi:SAM-dependent methyltransferase, partial [Streptomyces sp. TRM76130]|nr:SAM-dependent methyltransferase [Streptomyces sp. TRM76130]
LAQSAVPDVQMTTLGEAVHLVDVVTGSAAVLTPDGDSWAVREGGPVNLWERIERVLDAYDAAGAPGPQTFTLHVYGGGQHLRHPQMPGLPLPRP